MALEEMSTDTANLAFIEIIQEALDGGFNVIGLFFDLSNAYDMINYIIR